MTYLVLILVSLAAAAITWVVVVLVVMRNRAADAPYNSKMAIGFNLLAAAPVVLVPVAVAILIAQGVLLLSFGYVVLIIAGSILITTILTSMFSAIATRIELSSRADGRDAWAGVREASARAERRKERAAHLRQNPPKVLRCGICGKTNPGGHYVQSESGLLVCSGCHGSGYRNDPDIAICPSCGYRMDPGDNYAYFRDHRCAHCGVALQ
jgi:hypothetical protein